MFTNLRNVHEWLTIMISHNIYIVFTNQNKLLTKLIQSVLKINPYRNVLTNFKCQPFIRGMAKISLMCMWFILTDTKEGFISKIVQGF